MTEEEFKLNNQEYALTKTEFKIGDIIEHQLTMPDTLMYTRITDIYAEPYPDSVKISIYGFHCDIDGNEIKDSPISGIAKVNSVINLSNGYNRIIKNVGKQ